MIAAAWFVVIAPLVSGVAVAPPPRVVWPVVWEWDACHPRYRVVVSETGERVRELLCKGRLVLDPERGTIEPTTIQFQVFDGDLRIKNGFEVNPSHVFRAVLGKGERIPHSATRIAYPIDAITSANGKLGGPLVNFKPIPLKIELLLDYKSFKIARPGKSVFEPAGYPKP